VPEEIDQVQARLATIRGEISVFWQKSDSIFNLELEIPTGSRARLFLPVLWSEFRISEHKEKELILWDQGTYVNRENDDGISREDINEQPVFWLDSGSYLFRMEKI
jgi:hypothetical protein